MFTATRRGHRLAWSRLVDLGSIDSGSNPGGPTINFLKEACFKLVSGLLNSIDELQFSVTLYPALSSNRISCL
jgi:hypothetical protein